MPKTKAIPAKSVPKPTRDNITLVQPAPIDEPLAHIASVYNVHPGEPVIFSTRLQLYSETLVDSGQAGSRLTKDAQQKTAGYTLTMLAPRGLELQSYTPVDHPFITAVFIQDSEEGARIHWQLKPGLTLTPVLAGSQKNPDRVTLEFTTQTMVAHRPGYQAILPYAMQMPLSSSAILRDGEGMIQSDQRVQIIVQSQSKLMNYLPEIYAGNEFLGRFLMVFESFWKNMELQIDHGELYYTPGLAPVSFLPWLGSWIGFDIEADLPEYRKRHLLAVALGLFQKRGTMRALREYLQIYSGATPERGGEVKISEHRGKNMVLGQGSHLGVTCALGTENRPHTFTVYLNVPKEALQELYPPDPANSENKKSDETIMKLFRHRIETIIMAQKPAHTDFKLNIQVLEDVNEKIEWVNER